MRKEAVKWALVFIAMGFVNAFGAVLRQLSFAIVTERLVMRVRAAVIRSILRQHVGWFDASSDHTAGALVNRLSNDCFLLQALTGERASIALSQVVVLVGGLYISFSASWKLTLVIFGIIPLIVLPVAVSAKMVGKYSEAAAQSTVDAGRTVSETLLHLRTVAAFGLEGARIAQFADELAPVLRHDVRKGLAVGVGGGVAAGTILLAAGFKYYIGGGFFANGWVEFPQIMRVLLVLIFMAFGFASVSKAATDRAEAQGAARRVHELVHAEPTIDALSTEGAAPATRAAGRIELRDVHFAYPSRLELPVYQGLNLTIEAGQTVALAGPSGCGKSTVVSLLERFYDTDGGAVLLDGVDVKNLNVRWLRAQIGLVSQEPVLFAGTIGWNISMGRDGATQEEVEAAATLSNAAGFVASFPAQYATEVGEKGVQLSGGQKQRLAIARALVRDPAILVLDEATSALDNESEAIVQAALDELLASGGRTTLVIAHRLSTIRNADKIAVIEEGRVVEQGTHTELIERDAGVYRALVQYQEAAEQAPDEPRSRRASKESVGSAGSFSKPRSRRPTPQLAGGAIEAGGMEARPPLDPEGVMDVVSAAKLAMGGGDEAEAEAEAEGAEGTKGGKKGKKPKPPVPMSWIWRLSAPEKLYYVSGLLGAGLTGLAMPAIGLLMAEFIVVFFNPSPDEMRREAVKWALVFIAMGFVNAFGAVLRQLSFAIVTERLVMRVRAAVFRSILRQHVGWFDASSDHTAGALVNRLSNDCFLLQALTGERASIALSQVVVLVGD